jgi:hypothetical protein
LDPVVSIVLPVILWALGAFLARREWKQYRVAEDIGSDLFVYSRGRLIRRMTGVAMLLALGTTLAALGLFPARTASGASIYMALLISEVLVLLVLPLFDLWETARTARPHDLTKQGGPPPKTRKRSRPANPR